MSLEETFFQLMIADGFHEMVASFVSNQSENETPRSFRRLLMQTFDARTTKHLLSIWNLARAMHGF